VERRLQLFHVGHIMTFSQAEANEKRIKGEREREREREEERGDIMRKVEEDCHEDVMGH